MDDTDLPGPMPWQGAGGGEPVYRKTLSPTLDDHMAVEGHRWLRKRSSFVIVFIGIGFALGLFQGYEDYRVGDMAGFAVSFGITIALFAVLAWPIQWIFAKAMRRVIEAELRRRGLIGMPYQIVFSRSGIVVEEGAPEKPDEIMSSHSPWGRILAIEYDVERYLFWIALRRAFAVHRASFASPEEEEAFRQSVERWSGKKLVSPPVFVKHRRGRLDEWGNEPAGPRA